jgi:hypothetical protein
MRGDELKEFSARFCCFLLGASSLAPSRFVCVVKVEQIKNSSPLGCLFRDEESFASLMIMDSEILRAFEDKRASGRC